MGAVESLNVDNCQSFCQNSGHHGASFCGGELRENLHGFECQHEILSLQRKVGKPVMIVVQEKG